jgi:hypothetical protein
MSKLFKEECPKLHKVLSAIGKVNCLDANFEALRNYPLNHEKSDFNYLGIELTTKKELATNLIEYINEYLSEEPAFLRIQVLNEVNQKNYRHYVDIVIKEIEEAIKTNKFPKQEHHFDSLIKRCETNTKQFIEKMPKAIKDYRMKKCNNDEYLAYLKS